MIQVNTDDMKLDLSAIIHYVEAGETFVLLKAGKPRAEIKPIPSVSAKSTRPFGLCAGKFVVPNDFDAPLPQNIIAEFEGR